MAKATIKSKTGAVITIEGTEAEVSGVIAHFERNTAVHHAKTEISKADTKKKEMKQRRTASDMVLELREGGFFDKAKGLNEVSEALEEKGYIVPTTSLSGVMLGLVQRKLLGRKKVDGKWVYGQ